MRYSKALDGAVMLPFKIDNPGFSSDLANSKRSREETLATGCAPCCGMTKGANSTTFVRALEVFENLDIARVVEVFGLDLDRSEQSISRVQAHERMFAKLTN